MEKSFISVDVRFLLIVLFLALSPAISFAETISEGLSDKPAVNVLDLRLQSPFPGPRYITQADMEDASGSGMLNTIGSKPGYAFLASALLPGLGQAANDQWWKTALFVAAEATAIGIFIHRENRGRDGERYYEVYGNDHWSVVQYAQFIIDEHGHQHGKSFRDVIDEDYVNYNPGEPYGGIAPAFDINIDWKVIDLDALNEAERNSRFSNGNPFSHYVEPYGSQQYYELMSKYYQFGPGWRLWPEGNYHIEDSRMPADFLYHAQVGYDFNHDLGVARNMLMLLVTNHFVAAFDAFFTQKVRQARVQPSASMEYGLRPTVGISYRF
ncbi:DUF5683 domain-containing protein [Balneolaceae bacterium ANBcel3]|nr:DUF5683 domain-containing protein [Balneolaceae bacterium ANBcel3]